MGEASHPGPRVREMHRRRVASSSDDEPLVRPIVGRDVIPRREAGSVVTATGREASHNRYVALRDVEVSREVEFGVHLGEEFDLTVADSPDEAEATVPESVLDTLEADLIPPVQSTVPASVDVATTAIVSASTVPASSRALREVHGGSPSTNVPTSLPGVVSFHDDEEAVAGSLVGNRFAVLSDNRSVHAESEVPVPVRPRRRLVLVSQDQNVEVSDHEWDPDTDSIGGASDVEVVDFPAPTVLETPLSWSPGSGHLPVLTQSTSPKCSTSGHE